MRGRGVGGMIGGVGTTTRVYVGNLSWETSWQDLKDHFRSAGEVTHADVMQDSDGRSKGCGLVAFANGHDAANAISTLHDSILGGRSIFVREDREAALPGLPAPGAKKATIGANAIGGIRIGGTGGGAGGATTGTRVYVGNLSWETSWQDLKDHFRSAGEVIHADVLQDSDGRSKGCGLVAFANAHDAANAIAQLHQTLIKGIQTSLK